MHDSKINIRGFRYPYDLMYNVPSSRLGFDGHDYYADKNDWIRYNFDMILQRLRENEVTVDEVYIYTDYDFYVRYTFRKGNSQISIDITRYELSDRFGYAPIISRLEEAVSKLLEYVDKN